MKKSLKMLQSAHDDACNCATQVPGSSRTPRKKSSPERIDHGVVVVVDTLKNEGSAEMDLGHKYTDFVK